MIGDHSSRKYNHDLDSIHSGVLQMGGLVESQFRDAVACFKNNYPELADDVIKRDEQVNQLEIILDDACSHLIVKRQPAANDLRTVMATIKVITDLERIGDESAKIARTATTLYATNASALNHYAAIHVAAEVATVMLHDALDAFARLDEKQAARVIGQDLTIDQEFRKTLQNLIRFMIDDPQAASSVMDVIWAAKAIERIGDHAKNIAEYVIYIVEGKDVRHTGSRLTDEVSIEDRS